MNNFTRRVKKIHTIGTCLYEIMVVILTLCATTCLYSDELQDDIQYFKDLKNNLSKNTTDENCNKWINGIEEKYLKHKDHPIYAAYYAYPSYVKTNDVNKALLMLVPFMQENVTYPRISLAFWELFYCGLRNTEYGHVNGWEKVLNGIDKKEQPEALKKLTAYWASLVPGSFITPTSNVWEAKKLKVDMAECRAVWKIVFRNLMKMELAEEYEEILARQRREQEEKNKVQEAQYQKSIEAHVRKELNRLDTFLEKPNDWKKMEDIIQNVASVGRYLKNKEHVPNYDELKGKIGVSEADVIDIAFNAYVFHKAEESLVRIGKVEGYENDDRLLRVKIYCQRKLNKPKQEMLETISQLLKLVPNDKAVLMLKYYLELEDKQ